MACDYRLSSNAYSTATYNQSPDALLSRKAAHGECWITGNNDSCLGADRAGTQLSINVKHMGYTMRKAHRQPFMQTPILKTDRYCSMRADQRYRSRCVCDANPTLTLISFESTYLSRDCQSHLQSISIWCHRHRVVECNQNQSSVWLLDIRESVLATFNDRAPQDVNRRAVFVDMEGKNV